MAADVSVVIPLYNERLHVERTVSSVLRAASDRTSVEVIVVDNGSTDGSYELLADRYLERILLLQAPDLTLGAVRNFGARHATGSHFLFLDADCSIDRGYFGRALEVLDTEAAAATGCRVSLPPDDSTRLQRAWESLHRPPKDGFVHYINSGNFFITRSDFEQVGGFDETLLSGEDFDLCRRLRASGRRIYQACALRAYHYGVPQTVSDFLRQQFWHGLGMFGTSTARLNKPTLMMFVHAGAVLTGLLAVALLRPRAPTALALVATTFLAVPALTVLYRSIRARRLAYPLTGVLLYFLYFTCRLSAWLVLLGRRLGLFDPGRRGWKRSQTHPAN